MKSPDPPRQNLTLAFRIACCGGALVLVIAYAVLLPMKSHGMLPPQMTWIRVIAGPALLAGYIPALLFVPMRFPNRPVLGFCMMSLAFIVAGLILMILDPVAP
jgi:hypothetical protein